MDSVHCTAVGRHIWPVWTDAWCRRGRKGASSPYVGADCVSPNVQYISWLVCPNVNRSSTSGICSGIPRRPGLCRRLLRSWTRAAESGRVIPPGAQRHWEATHCTLGVPLSHPEALGLDGRKAAGSIGASRARALCRLQAEAGSAGVQVLVFASFLLWLLRYTLSE
jgi:hypothetical protein